MPHCKIVLSYDGTSYHGWQIQPTLDTIQGTLAQALYRITGETVLPQGSGRTDAGVHALAQVATFSLRAPIPAVSLLRALNRALPRSIRVLTVDFVPQDFHARHSAQRKIYEYRILPGDRICAPTLAPYVWACGLRLDLNRLNDAAAHILGTHDFTSFAAANPDLATRMKSVGSAVQSAAPSPSELPHVFPTTRTIFHSDWTQHGDLIHYTVTGSGFLHHMVRNLVGTFVEAGAGRISPDAIPTILRSRSRSAAGATAPARGLFLAHVEY